MTTSESIINPSHDETAGQNLSDTATRPSNHMNNSSALVQACLATIKDHRQGRISSIQAAIQLVPPLSDQHALQHYLENFDEIDRIHDNAVQ